MLRPTILTGIIKPLTVNANIPQPAFGAEPPLKEPGNGALEAGNFTPENTSGDDEVPPDFSGLDPEEEAKAGNPPAVDKTAPKGEEPPKAPDEPPKPPAGAPAKPATPPSKGPNEPIPEIPAFKPGQAAAPVKEDHPTDPNRYKDGTFKPGKEPKEPKPAAATPPAATPPAAPVAKPATPEPPKPVPKDDADVDAIEPKATASDKTKNDFKALKDSTKAARAYARELETKLAAAESKVAGELPADVKEKLARLDEAEKFKAMFELENEPRAREDYTKRLTATEDAIIKTLTEDPRLTLPKEKAEWLKKVGFDSPEAIAQINKWVAQVANGNAASKVEPNPLLAQELVDLFRSRAKVVADRNTEIEGLRNNRDAYLSKRQEAEKGEFEGWGKKADARLEQIAMQSEWADFKKAPDNATPEQLAFVEAHNKKVKEEIVPRFQKDIADVYQRNPERTIELIFAAHQAENEYKPKIAALEAENAAHVARIAELEQMASGVRTASQLSQADQATRTPVPAAPLGTNTSKEVDVEEAFSQWEASRK